MSIKLEIVKRRNIDADGGFSYEIYKNEDEDKTILNSFIYMENGKSPYERAKERFDLLVEEYKSPTILPEIIHSIEIEQI